MLLAFVASRLMVCGVILLSRLQVPPGPFFAHGGLLEVLSSGDAARYLNLVEMGPWFRSVASDPVQAFFPVFPMLVEMMAALLGNAALAGVVVANLSLLGAGLLLHRLVRLQFPDSPRTSEIAVMLLMFSPASYFFSSAVPDSTALLLAVGALLAAVQHRWAIASLCGLILCGTVNLGYWIIVPLVCEFLRQRAQPDARADRPGLTQALLLSLVLMPLAAATVFGYTRLGNAWALLRLSRGAELTVESLLQMSRYFEGYASFYEWVFRGTLLVAAGLCFAAYGLRLGKAQWAFPLALIVICFWSYDLQAARTLGLAFPLVTILAALSTRFEVFYESFLTCSMTLLALCTIVAANGFWGS